MEIVTSKNKILIFDYFEDLLHRLCLFGLNCFEEIGMAVMSF